MKRKAKFFNPILGVYLLFMIAFSGAAVAFFCGLVMPDIIRENISKNKNEIRIATITSVTRGTTVNDEQFYKILYEWEDAAGNLYSGSTGSAYTTSEAAKIMNQGTVEIRTSGNRSAVVPFKKSADRSVGWFLIPFFLVGVGMGIAFFRGVWQVIRQRTTARFGTSGKGFFVDSKIGYYMNDTPMHSILFTFENGSGETIEVKTPSYYYKREEELLKKLKEFPIKHRRNYAVIMQDHRATTGLPAKSAEKVETTECLYCGLKNLPEHNRCSACGAILK